MGEKDGKNRADPASEGVRHPVQQLHRATGDPVLMNLVDRAHHRREEQGRKDRPPYRNAGLPSPQGAQKPHHAVEPEVSSLVRKPERKV